MTSPLLEFISTTALHSIVLCAAALLLAHRVVHPEWRSWIFRAAVLAPFLTAGAQTLAGTGLSVVPERISVQPSQQATSPLSGGSVETLAVHGDEERIARRGQGAAVHASNATPPGPATWLLAAWLAFAAALVASLFRRRRGFIRTLERRPLGGSTIASNTEVRLTQSSRLSSPVTLSMSEICVPARTWPSFSSAERDAMLAHETVHIERADPVWRLAMQIAAALLFFQPLVPLAIRREAAAAEFDCDDRATRRMCDPLALAGAMSRLARELVSPSAPRHDVPHTMPAITTRKSDIIHRVERLVGESPTRPSSRATKAFAASVVAAIGAVACAGPSAGSDDRDEPDSMGGPHAGLVVQIDADGSARVESRADVSSGNPFALSSRAGRTALGQALVDLREDMDESSLAESDEADTIPPPMPTPVTIRIAPSTPMKYVQFAMEQAAQPNAQFWNLILEPIGGSDARYPIPLPVDDGILDTPEVDELVVRINSSPTKPGSVEYLLWSGIRPAGMAIPEEESLEEQEAEPVAKPEPVVATSPRELEEEIRRIASKVSRDTGWEVVIDPRKRTSVADVINVLRSLDDVDRPNHTVLFLGSYED